MSAIQIDRDFLLARPWRANLHHDSLHDRGEVIASLACGYSTGMGGVEFAPTTPDFTEALIARSCLLTE
jgi:hypothetical protein